jgi:dihydroorotate dehydrogenase (fumarate)
MTASALYKKGIGYLKRMNEDLATWMRMMEFSSLKDFKGTLSQQHVSDPTAFERANYIKILQSKR